MTFLAALSLFFIMLALAALPSASVALVVARSTTHGVRNGAAVALGIVLGDLVFVALAILGMGILAETMGAFFAVFKYIGGGYLIWLGIGLIRSKNRMSLDSVDVRGSTLLKSLFAGLFLTLGDVKAILFYASLFPTFVDMETLTVASVSIIVAVTIVTVGGVKLAYAFAARRMVTRLRKHAEHQHASQLAGGLMVGTGAYLISKS